MDDDKAQSAQEPVVCKHQWFRTGTMAINECRCMNCGAWNTVAPPQREWVDLTEDQIKVIEEIALTKQWAIRMTIAQLKECNT